MKNDIAKVLVSEEEIDKVVEEIAKEIDHAYSGKRLLLVGILKGSIVFMRDLMKKLTIPVEIDFMKVSSYGAGTVSTGNIAVHLDLCRQDVSDCHILVVEDIIDSGRTLTYLVDYLKKRGALSVRTCTLLDKPSRRVVDYKADIVGKIIPDEFVVGYGLDFNEKYRTLPFIGVLKPEVYQQ